MQKQNNMLCQQNTLTCEIIGTPKRRNFSFGTYEKLMVLGFPILKHSRVIC